MATSMQAGQKVLRVEKARWRLALIWFPGCALIFLIMVGQSIGEVYGDETQRAWGWALPNFLPTLALMMSVFAAEALSPYEEKGVNVRLPFFYLAAGLSAFYVLLILTTLLTLPFSQPGRQLEHMEMSNMWLGPLQGLVVAVLGALFFLKEQAKDDDEPEKAKEE